MLCKVTNYQSVMLVCYMHFDDYFVEHIRKIHVVVVVVGGGHHVSIE